MTEAEIDPSSKAEAGTSATAVGASVDCASCQRETAATRRFCSGCGQSLWQKCPSCKLECAASDKFCGSCGADVAAAWAQRERDCRLRLDEARELLVAHHFDAAARCLRAVATESEPRLESYAARALAEIAQIEQAKACAASHVGSGIDQARQFIENAAYERAIEVLENVPQPLRSEEHLTLLERAKSARQEVLTLSGEIREAVTKKLVSDLGPKLERLLALVPSHAQGRQLAEQLRDYHVKVAKTRLKSFKYQEALDQLSRVPQIVANETIETLRDTASELAALTRELREGALADKNHLALAERLCKLAPQDETATKLLEQVLQRRKTAPGDSRFGAANLAAPPKRTLLGPPIDWLAQLKQVTCADDAAKRTLQEHPGAFFVALGLALQGVRMAAIELDLTPKPSSGGLIGSLSALGGGKRTGSMAWGLDLSEHSLKAIQLQVSGKAVQVKAVEWIAVEPTLSRTDAAGQAENVQRTLAEFVKRAGDLKGVKICVDLPSQRVLGRFFELPPMPAKRLAESLQYEAKHQIPIPLEDLCWSHAILDAKQAKADDQPRRILLQAARETHVRDRIGRFKEAGIVVDIVQSNAVALINALRFEWFSQADEEPSGAVAAIDVGAEATNVVVVSPRCAWFRTFGHGGETFSRELQRKLLLTSEQSALLLREPARAKRFSRWIAALEPLYQQFSSEVTRSLATYQKLWPDQPVRQIFGLGGALPVVGLLRHLRTGR